jgi:hypothetical protein
MTDTPYTVTLRVAPGTRQARLTLTSPDAPEGLSVARPGMSETHAITNALRGMADLLDSARRQRLREANATQWVRLSIDVDVEVMAADVELARQREDAAQSGDMVAARDIMNLALEWLGTAMYDKDSRDWQSFDWALVEDCDPDDFPEA